MKLLAVVFIALAVVPAMAQDESLAPDGENNDVSVRISNDTDCTAPTCDAADCHLDVDEDPGSPDGLELVTFFNNDTIRFTFPTPSGDPSTSADAQNIHVNWTRTTSDCVEAAGGSDPNYMMTLFCNGVSKFEIVSSTDVTSLDQNDSSNTFTYATDGDCDAAGANVEVEVMFRRAGGGANRRFPALNAIEWEVTYSGGPGWDVIVISD